MFTPGAGVVLTNRGRQLAGQFALAQVVIRWLAVSRVEQRSSFLAVRATDLRAYV